MCERVVEDDVHKKRTSGLRLDCRKSAIMKQKTEPFCGSFQLTLVRKNVVKLPGICTKELKCTLLRQAVSIATVNITLG